MCFLVFCTLACGHSADAPAVRSEPVLPLATGVHRGMSVAHSWQAQGSRGYGSPTSAATLRELQALGVSHVSLTPFGFMSSLTSEEVRIDPYPDAGETDARVRREIASARALGLEVFLKPHVWIARGAFRGRIAPVDWSAWFASYSQFVLHYARLAEETGASLFAVGVEFSASLGRERAWRRLIAGVRAVYSGQLVYCANWDAVDRVSFWRDLDYVGVQFYAPLATASERTEQAMARRLETHLAALSTLSDRVRRPVLLTEVGYKSVEGTAVAPHTWPERAQNARVSFAEQAQAYRVLWRGVQRHESIRGVYVWKWFSDPESDEEDARGFALRGKPALEVLTRAYAPSG